MIKNNLKIIVTLSIFILYGCAIGPGRYKEGVNYDDTQNVLSKCKYDIGIALVSYTDRPELIAECMRSQGYRYKNYSHNH